VKRPKGPELKMPDLKVPTLLADLYYDLRDRRLLPLIALVLVAIVATPFLLSQGSEEEEEEAIPVPAAIQALKESGGRRTSTLTVVEANPGLRDYRKRLHERTPLDPFRSFGKPSLKGAQLGGKSEGEGGGSGSSAPITSTSTTVKKTKESSKTTSTTKTTTKPPDGGEKGPGGNGGSTAGGGKEASTYTIDVQITIATDSGVSVKPVERLDVQPLTPLPGSETPVITYLGAGSGGTKALFSVSKEVSAVFGEVKCVSGTDTCEAIELEPDFPVTFVYGPDQARYRIKLIKIKLTKKSAHS
jgi:hypothetical protein